MYKPIQQDIPTTTVSSTLPSQSRIKVAIITGASSGIGRAASIALCEAGWKVVLSARREAELNETKRLCEEAARQAGLLVNAGITRDIENTVAAKIGDVVSLVVPGDVSKEEDVKRLFAEAASIYGRVDLLFNNAGISGPTAPIQEASLADFRAVLDVNVVASFLCTQQALLQFASQTPRGGRIINNGSLAAHAPRPHSAAYAISKHAVWGLTKSTSLEGRKCGVAVTQIDVGNALTPMAAGHASVGALQGDGSMKVEAAIDPKHIASSIVHIANLPLEVTVLQMNVMPTEMPYIGRG